MPSSIGNFTHECAEQELREVVARSAGIVLMAPPHDSVDAQGAIATLVSSINSKKHKVRPGTSCMASALLAL